MINKNAEIFSKTFENSLFIVSHEDINNEQSYYIYALKNSNTNKIVEKHNEKEIGCGIYYPVPLHLQGVYINLGYKEGDLPITEELAKTTFAIHIYPELLDEERKTIIDIILSCVDLI